MNPLIKKSVSAWISDAKKADQYQLGDLAFFLVNPTRQVLARLKPEFLESVIVVLRTPLSAGPSMDSTVRHVFLEALKCADESVGVEGSAFLDLSGTSGLFALLADALGAAWSGVYSDDIDTVSRNFNRNGSKAEPVTRRKIAKLQGLGQVIFDLHCFPDLVLLRACADRIMPGGTLVMVGILGQHFKMLESILEPLGFVLRSSGWANEHCHGVYEKMARS